MNHDPFTLLAISPRPYLDPELLESQIRRLAARHHPDQQEGNLFLFQELQAAATQLRKPSSRLKILADSQEKIPFSTAAAALFQTIASALEESKVALAAYHTTLGALAKALLMPSLLESHSKLLAAQEELQEWEKILNKELQQLDASWPQVDKKQLLSLANSFTFAERWAQQLREQLLAFTLILG